MHRKLTIGSCFSGIGGIELGLEWTGGFKTLWQIEMDKYATAVLAKHWPDVKRYSDIRDVVRPEPVDLICGGFPCQDVSLAGQRKGLEGKRSTLWSEMFRLVCEVKPRWVVAENVPGLLSSDGGRFFGNILRDLAGGGYHVEWGVLSAAGVGAPHLRRRIFIIGKLAHTESNGMEGCKTVAQKPSEGEAVRGIERESEDVPNTISDGLSTRDRLGCENTNGGGNAPEVGESNSSEPRQIRQDVSDSEVQPSRGLSKRKAKKVARIGNGSEISDTSVQRLSDGPEKEIQQSQPFQESKRSDWWSVEPNVGRVAHGIPSRVDRLKCLGNAVVPQVAQRIGEIILMSGIV